MARRWKERYDPGKHRNHMWRVEYPRDRLIVHWIYFVVVCGVTLEFHSLGQIATCLGYYSKKIRPSSREPMSLAWGGDEWEARDNMLAYHWEDRLPQYLLEEPNRLRVIKALQGAMSEFGAEGSETAGANG